MLFKIQYPAKQKDVISPRFLSATPSVSTLFLPLTQWWIFMTVCLPAGCLSDVIPYNQSALLILLLSLLTDLFKGHATSVESRQRLPASIVRRESVQNEQGEQEIGTKF